MATETKVDDCCIGEYSQMNFYPYNFEKDVCVLPKEFSHMLIPFYERFFDNVNSTFEPLSLLKDTNVFFREVDKDNKEVTMTVEKNGETQNILHIFDMNIEFAFSLHGTSFYQKVLELIDFKNSDYLTNVDKTIHHIQEMEEWQNSLNSSSLGYTNIYNEDIETISQEILDGFDEFVEDVAQKMKDNYFNYSQSLIKDLSTFHGVKFFEWDTELISVVPGEYGCLNYVCDYMIHSLIIEHYLFDEKTNHIVERVFKDLYEERRFS